MALMAKHSQEHLTEELRRAEQVLTRLNDRNASYPVLRFAERHVRILKDQLSRLRASQEARVVQTSAGRPLQAA